MNSNDRYELCERLDRIAVAVERLAVAFEPTTVTTGALAAEAARCPRKGGADWQQCVRPVAHSQQHVAENGHSW